MGGKFVVWLDEVNKEDLPLVGGKAAGLGETARMGAPIPPGFVITTEAFNYFIRSTGLHEEIKRILSSIIDKTPEEYERVSSILRRLIEGRNMPKDLEEIIAGAYMELSARTGVRDVPVAVRSSATAEDINTASFAGQQETYLNVRGAGNVIEYVKKVWSSLYTARAMMYRDKMGIADAQMAVVVQKLLNSRSSGVLFTLDPVTGDRGKIVIESAWGLGESVVGGFVTPDRWIVDKETLSIVDKRISRKSVAIIRDEGGLTRKIELPEDKALEPSLSDDEVIRLATIALRLERHYGNPLDIEWAIDADMRPPDNIFILQVRPETVWRSGKVIDADRAGELVMEARAVVKGIPASPGVAVGKARVCLTLEEARGKFRKGDILVTKMTNPDWVPYMRDASAIVTDEGGLTSHAAIVSRELGIPAIVGTGNATKTMRDGAEYTVDATHGVVYEGVIKSILEKRGATKETGATDEIILHLYRSVRTATGIYMNLGVPEKIDEYRNLPFDGIGLMRIEFVIASYIGEHPLHLVALGNEDKFVNKLAEGVAYVARAIYPRPVIVRFSDFKSNEYRQLRGGEKFEPEERNPMLGWRGASRYISSNYEKAFRLEVRAIRKVREEWGLRNVHVMIPFVRAPWEAKALVEVIEDEGLRRGRDFKVYAMAEIPSIVLLTDEFSRYVDGYSVGSNDLTQLIMGVDRDNEVLVRQDPRYFDEREPSVLRAMFELIRRAHKYGKSVGICGQAPSVYPEVAEFLVRAGIDYLSVNPDSIIQTRLLVDSIERKIIMEKLHELERKIRGVGDIDEEFKETVIKVFGRLDY